MPVTQLVSVARGVPPGRRRACVLFGQRRGKLRAASTKWRHVSQSYKVRREEQDLVEIETRLGMPGGEGCHLTGSVKS